MPKRWSSFLGALLVLACNALFAEQASKSVSQAKSENAPPESAPDSAEAPPPVLFLTGKAAAESSDSKPVTRVEAELVDAEASTALNTYLNSSVLPMIRASWYRLVSKSTENIGGDATIEFTVLKDGSVGMNNLTEGTGHATLGDVALRAVRKSEPFPVLPAEIMGPFLTVRAHFWYEGSKPSSTPLAKGVTLSMDGVNEPVYSVGGRVIPPRPIYDREPEFSDEARRKKISGSVTLTLIVTSKGEVTDVKVVHSLGSGLDEKAIEAVKQWKFKPATKDGEPVAVQLAVEVDFKIRTKSNQ